MLNLKNALRWVKTANALVLVGCAVVFAPQSGFAQAGSEGQIPDQATCTTNSGSTAAIGGNADVSGTNVATSSGACAGGTGSIAIGVNANVSDAGLGGEASSSTAIGISSSVSSRSAVSLGSSARIGTNAGGSVAIGASAYVLDGHSNSVALGLDARTSAAHRIELGATRKLFRNQNSNNAQYYSALTTSYRFAGLALSEDGIGASDLLPGEAANLRGGVFTPNSEIGGIVAANQYTDAQVDARNVIINRYRSNAASRALVVDGHGVLSAVDADLSNIGTASQDSAGTGTLYQRIASLRSSSGGGERYDDTAVVNRITATETAIGSYSDSASDAASASLHARINKNRADIASFQSAGVSSETMAQIDGNTAQGQKNAQGVALGNALASLPRALLPGERLRLGIGVGSFDGKSGTAIGVMGKFGASTLLNAGFSTGGGESSTQVGISWGW